MESKQYDKNYLTFNSLISISLVNNNYLNNQESFIVQKSNNLNENFEIKKCNKISDIIKISNSIFQVKDCSLFNIDYSKYNSKNELRNLNSQYYNNSNNLVFYNNSIILYHVFSKKYLSLKKNSADNYYELILTTEINASSKFTLNRIFKSDLSKLTLENKNINAIKYQDIMYLSSYIKDRDQIYSFSVDENNKLSKTSNFKNSLDEYNIDFQCDIFFSIKNKTKIKLIDQNNFINKFDEFCNATSDGSNINKDYNLINSDIINIYFTLDNAFLLGAKEVVDDNINRVVKQSSYTKIKKSSKSVKIKTNESFIYLNKNKKQNNNNIDLNKNNTSLHSNYNDYKSNRILTTENFNSEDEILASYTSNKNNFFIKDNKEKLIHNQSKSLYMSSLLKFDKLVKHKKSNSVEFKHKQINYNNNLNNSYNYKIIDIENCSCNRNLNKLKSNLTLKLNVLTALNSTRYNNKNKSKFLTYMLKIL